MPAVTFAQFFPCDTILKGFDSAMADFYDLFIGLHPDEAALEVGLSAEVRRLLAFPVAIIGTGT